MALVKIINCGDELVFDLSKMATSARKQISISLSEKAGKMAVLVIRADLSIPIQHIREQKLYNDKEDSKG